MSVLNFIIEALLPLSVCLFLLFSCCLLYRKSELSDRPATAYERHHFRKRLRVRWRNVKEHQRLMVQREVQRLSDVIALRLYLKGSHSWGDFSVLVHTRRRLYMQGYTHTHTLMTHRMGARAKPVPVLLQIMNTSIWSWIRNCPSTALKNGNEKPAR